METIKLTAQETSERFQAYKGMHGNRFTMLMDAYGEFQDSVAMWRDNNYVLFGLAEEAIEYQMATKAVKQQFRGDTVTSEQEIDRLKNVEKELGDIFFFWYANCKLWGLDPLEVIAKNVEKLSDRASRNVIKGDGDVR